MKGEPEAGARARRGSRRTDAALVEVPRRSAAAHELQRPCSIVQRCLHRWPDAFRLSHRDEAIVDRRDGYSRLQQRFDIHKAVDALLLTALPSAAMDHEDKGCRGARLRLPEIEDLPSVRAIADLAEGRLRHGRGVSRHCFPLGCGLRPQRRSYDQKCGQTEKI